MQCDLHIKEEKSLFQYTAVNGVHNTFLYCSKCFLECINSDCVNNCLTDAPSDLSPPPSFSVCSSSRSSSAHWTDLFATLTQASSHLRRSPQSSVIDAKWLVSMKRLICPFSTTLNVSWRASLSTTRLLIGSFDRSSYSLQGCGSHADPSAPTVRKKNITTFMHNYFSHFLNASLLIGCCHQSGHPKWSLITKEYTKLAHCLSCSRFTVFFFWLISSCAWRQYNRYADKLFDDCCQFGFRAYETHGYNNRLGYEYKFWTT